MGWQGNRGEWGGQWGWGGGGWGDGEAVMEPHSTREDQDTGQGGYIRGDEGLRAEVGGSPGRVLGVLGGLSGGLGVFPGVSPCHGPTRRRPRQG